MNNPGRNFLIFCNYRAGKGKPERILPEVISRFTQSGITFEVLRNDLPVNTKGFTDILIIGGDGTVNFAINNFGEINLPLSVIGCGTGNDFATCLLGNISIQEQIETAINGKLTGIDAGLCNGRLFLNGTGIGFDGMVSKRNLTKSFFTGKLAYLSAVIPLLFFYDESKVEIITETFHYSGPMFMLTAANGTSVGGGFYVTPKALLDDGLLDIMLVKKIGILKRIRYLPIIEKGRHLKLSEVIYDQCRKVTLISDTLLYAHLDGELMESKKFEIEIRPKHFTFRTPKKH